MATPGDLEHSGTFALRLQVSKAERPRKVVYERQRGIADLQLRDVRSANN